MSKRSCITVLLYFALLIVPACLSVSSRLAVQCPDRKGVKVVFGRKCSFASCKPRMINALHCNYMKATLPREALRFMHIFSVPYFDSFRTEISAWQLRFSLCGVGSGAMASSSTFAPVRQGNGFPLTSSWLYSFKTICTERYRFSRKLRERVLVKNSCSIDHQHDKTIADHQPLTTANDETIADHQPLTTANDETIADHQPLTTAND